MSVYARIFEGKVAEIITLSQTDSEGKEIPVELCYAPEFVSALVDITHVLPQPKEGYIYNGSGFSEPVQVVEPITKSVAENLRLIAYADPINGSDRYFSEVMSLQAEGFTATSAEVKDAKAKGLARKAEIQTLYPWPSE